MLLNMKKRKYLNSPFLTKELNLSKNTPKRVFNVKFYQIYNEEIKAILSGFSKKRARKITTEFIL